MLDFRRAQVAAQGKKLILNIISLPECVSPSSTDAKIHTESNWSEAYSPNIFLSFKLFIKFTTNMMEGMVLTDYEDLYGIFS